MSLDIQGSSCVRCKSYLFSEDDVVYCPVCGAPHHRECYNALGHCALEELHGTPEEYSRKKEAEKRQNSEEKKQEPVQNDTVKCEMCGEIYERGSECCPKCGTPDMGRMKNFAQFDFLGGVPGDYDLGEGVTANEAKAFVAANTHRYIPKFAVLNKKNKFSWNWMAFLFPTGWMLSRKMYKGGIIAGVFTVAATLLTYPLNLELYNMGFSQATYTAESLNKLAEIIPDIGIAAIGLAVAGTVFDLIVRVVSALLGDYMYKKYSIGTIKKIKAEYDNSAEYYRKKGGMSMLLFLLGIVLMQYAPALFTIFF